MPDDSLQNHLTLSFGLSGYGKTSWDIALLLNSPVRCRFIFDAWKDNEISRRTGFPSVATLADCEAQRPTKWVCFSPRHAKSKIDALRWFLDWTMQVCKRGPGPKLLYLPEYRLLTDGRKQPPEEVEAIARGLCRQDGLQVILSTQHPRDYCLDVRSEVTEWVGFHTEMEQDLEVVREWFPGVDCVKSFPPGKFVSYSPRSRSTVFGMLEPGWPPGTI